MTAVEIIPNQYWYVENFFEKQKFNDIKSSYRQSRMPFTMVYDNRLLTDYNTTPGLQQIVVDTVPFVSEIVGTELVPQVAYISIDLPGSRIMMHRLHKDIAVQVQVPMGEHHNQLSYSVCINEEINNAISEDYRPIRSVNKTNSLSAEYYPNTANIFYNKSRAFVGMLECVPANTIREVLVMSYQFK